MKLRERTMALAGAFQAARLVQQLAHEGRADAGGFASSILSIPMLDAGNTEEVFGGARGVRRGLELLRDKLSGAGETPDVEIARYVIATMHLAGQLARRADLQNAIRRGLEAAERQMKFFEAGDDSRNDGVHPRLVEKLAEIYIQTLSTLTPRIMVTGEHGYLVNPGVAAKVRAALFAGVRAAFLWRQLGGRRWQLLFGRRRIAIEAGKILDDLRLG